MENKMNRRTFLKNSALAGGALSTVGVGGNALLSSCSSETKPKIVPLKAPGTYYIPELPDMAKDGKALKAGLIGCGGRGKGAVYNFLDAANGLTVTAIGDTFKDKVDDVAASLAKDKNIVIPEDKRFIGLDAYQKVIDSDVDVVIIATPPYFRPTHFKYATDKGKHAFLEKPLCVDAVGYRSIAATAKQAAAKNLAVVTGNQRHHQRSYVESYKKIMEGLIGEITGGVVYWNQNQLWFRTREKEWSDCEWMIRDWVNWKWLSGDHIVEQHVHNIDVFTWFSGLKPASAVGFGSRERRVTGDQFDFFSVDFTMENGIHLHSMCRQIDGCDNNVSEFIQGTKGSWSSVDFTIKDLAGNVIWKYDFEAEKQYKQLDPYTLEHVNWINLIRSNQPIDMASQLAVSNMAAIMGRESAYTGNKFEWDSMIAATQDFTPADLNLTGKMDMSGFVVPVPGKGK
ncbi:MAG: Gfo/Idh/MocA family oxidoreductase [Candidatus Azobacteroides sp.]|nr:Gfo/Idh/MocA family oxidoreductase [Candidatus Azobacteroides sp.]